MITVRFTPEQSFELEVLHAEQAGSQAVTPGTACEIKGTPEVMFRIPGVGVICATGPTGSVDDLREQIAKADGEIEKLTAEFGIRDLDELQTLHTRAAAIDAELSNAQAALKALLAGRQTDDIRKERALIAVGTEAILRDYPDWSETLPERSRRCVRSMTTSAARSFAKSNRPRLYRSKRRRHRNWPTTS